MYRLFFQVRINLVVKWYNIYFYYSISVAYDPYIERAVPYMLKWFFPKPKISDCRLLFFSNGCNYASLIWLLHGFKVSKPIENHPLDYTMQKDFFQFPFLIDKPICIRIESLFLTIHLLDRRHYFVVESNQVRLAWFAFSKFMLALVKHLLHLICSVPQEFKMGKLYILDMYGTRKRFGVCCLI